MQLTEKLISEMTCAEWVTKKPYSLSHAVSQDRRVLMRNKCSLWAAAAADVSTGCVVKECD